MKFASVIQFIALLSVAHGYQYQADSVAVGTLFDYNAAFTGTKKCALVSVVMDESGSMAGEQAFMKDTSVPGIITSLKDDRGFDHVFLCGYGYGGYDEGYGGQEGDVRFYGCLEGNEVSVMPFTASGAFEDSFEAMTWTMTNFPGVVQGYNLHSECSSIAKNMVLVTDEDSDHSAQNDHTIQTTIAEATDKEWVINIICDCNMRDSSNNRIIGASSIDNDTSTKMYKQSGTTATYMEEIEVGALAPIVYSGQGDSATDYPPVTTATGGALWDVEMLRDGGNVALAFTAAFISVKVHEIETNPYVPTEVPNDRTVTDAPVVKPPAGGSSGDPHVKLWNRETFDFHGACDLVLVKAAEFANGLGLDINIRTKQETWWSYIESAVLRIGSDTFEVQGGVNTATYWLNGVQGELKDVGLSGYLAETVGGFQVHYKSVSNKQKDLRLDLGNGDWITLQTFNKFVRVNVKTGGDKKSRFTGAVGLMGQFPEGKMVDRAGEVVKNTDAFGKGWQVLGSEDMLFHNMEGVQHPEECQMPDMTKTSLKRRLGEALITEEDAALACARVAEEDRVACIFDVLATNDKDMAGSY